MIRRILFLEAIETGYHYVFPGAAYAYLVGSLRREFGPDRFEFRMVAADYGRAIDEFQPDLVGVTAMTAMWPYAIQAARAAAERGLPVVTGGIHITLIPESLTRDMTVGVMGEGERAVCDLIRLLDTRGSWRAEDLRSVHGICYRHSDGSLRTTPKRPLIDPLDSVGFPAWDILPPHKEPYVLTARGCPYQCVFCSSSYYWQTFRHHSPRHAVDLFEHAHAATRSPHIWILDDLFTTSRDRVQAIAKEVRRRKLHERIRFTVAGARVDLLDQRMIDALKSMGVVSLAFGIESGSKKALDYLKGGLTSVGQNCRAVELARKNGMIAFGYLIIGAPGETAEDARETLKFARDYLGEMFRVSLLTPLPGTPTWELALRKGLVGNDMDFGQLLANSEWDIDNAILLNDAMTRDELAMIYQEFVSLRKQREAENGVRIPAAGSQPFAAEWPAPAIRRLRSLRKPCIPMGDTNECQ